MDAVRRKLMSPSQLCAAKAIGRSKMTSLSKLWACPCPGSIKADKYCFFSLSKTR